MLNKYFFILISIFKNIFFKKKIFFVIDGYQWVIHEIGKEKEKYFGGQLIITSSSKFIKHSIIHFGSLNAFIVSKRKKLISKTNKIIVTIHHLPNLKENLKEIYENKNYVDHWIVSTKEIKEQIKKFIDSKQIDFINICIEEKYFDNFISKRYYKSSNIVIGSFVKDGGTSNNAPKFVKGPDILINILKRINQKIKVNVLLSGPNREWIKKELKSNNIKYNHYNYNYIDTINLYKEIDFLIVTSRIEGGPRSIMEAVHAKVPIISTNVGIIKDFFTNKKNFILIDENNIENSLKDIVNLIKDRNLRNTLINSANKLKFNFSLEKKIHRYKNIYSKIKKF